VSAPVAGPTGPGVEEGWGPGGEDGRGPDVEEGWQRFHPLTPLLRGGVMAVAAIGYVVSQQADRIWGPQPDDPTTGHLGIAAALVGAVIAVAVAAAWISWRAARYRLGPLSVELRHGIVMRQHRQVRYDRIQAVDITRPLLARLVGLSAVKVEAAGGHDSNIVLSFLPDTRAQEVRGQLLARARGASRPREGTIGLRNGGGIPEWGGPTEGVAATEGGGPEGGGIPGGHRGALGQDLGHPPATTLDPTGPIPEVLVAAIPSTRVWLATALAPSTVFLLIGIPALVAAFVAGAYPVLPVLGPMVVGAGGAQLKRLTSWMNFEVHGSAEAIRVRHGLTEVRARTVPIARIQAVEVAQPLLWRAFGWWRIQVNVAGVGPEKDAEHDALIPVGTFEEVMRILRVMGPAWSLPEVAQAMHAAVTPAGTVGLPRSARWLDPISWRRRGYAVTDVALVVRDGALTRTAIIVPHVRLQAHGADQGPLERRLGLASVRLHSTQGPVKPVVRHLAEADALALVNAQQARGSAARRGEHVLGPRSPGTAHTTTAVHYRPN
jgi:putative membrane protein